MKRQWGRGECCRAAWKKKKKGKTEQRQQHRFINLSKYPDRSGIIAGAPTWSGLSDSEFLRERLRVTMTEGLWLSRPGSSGCPGLETQLEAGPASSLSGEEGSCLRTGTDTGMMSGRRLSSRARLAPRPSGWVGLQGLWGS